MATVNRALQIFDKRKQWRRLQENGMAIDYSWKQRARTYGDLYQRILKERDH